MSRPRIHQATRKCLSIDWDFFFAYDPKLDWGFGESSIYCETLWAERIATAAARGTTLQSLLPWDGPTISAFYPRVWPVMKMAGERFDIAIAENHHEILPWLQDKGGAWEVWNFDAHHDVFYGDPTTQGLNPGNWVWRGMAKAETIAKYTLVYPQWRERFRETQRPMDSIRRLPIRCHLNARVMWWKDWLRVSNLPKWDAVFLCRSGGWTAPCYDDQFNRLARMFTPKAGEAIIPCRKVGKLAKGIEKALVQVMKEMGVCRG